MPDIRCCLLAACTAAQPCPLDDAFPSPVLHAVGDWQPGSVAAADLNADGRPDLVVACANPDEGAVLVLLADGVGGFLEPVAYPMGDSPQRVILVDVDNDDILDMVCTNSSGGQSIGARLGLGDGSFSDAEFSGAGVGCQGISAGDINGDGLIDIAVARVNSSSVGVLFGEGDGEFDFDLAYAAGTFCSDVEVVDLNNDGWLDLAVTALDGATVTRFLNYGEGDFSPKIPLGLIQRTNYIASSDLNVDGRMDLVVGHYQQSGDDRISILLGTGDATFADPIVHVVGLKPGEIRIDDLNDDGDLDIIVVNEEGGAIAVLAGDGMGGFAAAVGYGVTAGSRGLAIADFDADGRKDAAVGGWLANAVAIVRGTNTGFASDKRITTENNPTNHCIADVNADGLLDVIVVHQTDDIVSVALGQSPGAWALPVAYPVDERPVCVGAGDVDGDGAVDIISVNRDGDSLSVLYGFGDGSFEPELRIAIGNIPLWLVAEDFNGDGRTDVAVTIRSADHFSVYLGSDDGLQHHLDFATASRPTFITHGHVNNDGTVDLVVAHEDTSSMRIYAGLGDGDFAYQGFVSGGAIGQKSASLADLDGDGKSDLVSMYGDRIYTYIGDGQGDFDDPTSYLLDSIHPSIATGRFDDDDTVDVALISEVDDTLYAMLGVGDGTLNPPIPLATGDLPRRVIAVDNDGLADLYTVYANADSVGVNLNQCGACAADHNADGVLNVLDFVAFQLDWQAQAPEADCEPDGAFNILDFVCFQLLFTAGCS